MKDYKGSQELLNRDNFVLIHHRKLQVLTMEMFKIHRELSPKILREAFVSKKSPQKQYF